MSTVQIIGIAVASLVVLLLVVALVVTRRRGHGAAAAEERPAAGSFLDDAPQDTLSGLGRAEHPVEDVTIDPGVHREAMEAGISGGLGLDWGPESDPSPPIHDVVAAPAAPEPPPRPVDDEAESAIDGHAEVGGEADAEPEVDDDTDHDTSIDGETDDQTAIDGEAATTGAGAYETPPVTPDDSTEGDAVTAATQPAPLAEGEPAAEDAAASASGSGGRTMPLSDIICTTSSKMVDLEDPEVRRMLADLVAYEIDQATEFRRRGQTIDAVLQLTEAEKVSRALGMRESAERIRHMMEEIQRQG